MRSSSSRALVPTILLIAVGALAGCGGSDDTAQEKRQPAAAKGNPTEEAFLEAMMPHHQSAVEMTEVAATRARNPEIKMLASGIAQAQTPEIEQMKQIHQRLFGTALAPNEAAHEKLGLTPEQAGMHGGDPVMKLKAANPFDRAFVDEMVPHHKGAILMAQAVLPKTNDSQLRALAQSIISTQEKEVMQMNAFRTERYGGPVPGSDEEADEAEKGPGGHETAPDQGGHSG